MREGGRRPGRVTAPLSAPQPEASGRAGEPRASAEPGMCPAGRAPEARHVCRLLGRRAHGFYARDAGVAHRTNMRLLREIICQESTKFKHVWTTHSASPIAYERGRIYFDNYRCCISSIAQEPRILYQKPKSPKSEKIEDALLLECALGETLPSSSDYKSSLVVLTAQNWLLRLSADSGEILEKIYLAGSCCKFRYLSWDTPQEVMVIKSAQNKLPAAARQAGIQQSVLFYLAVFQVLPLSFIGMLEINKKIFGKSVTDVAVSNGVLIVMYSMGLVRLYNFQAISEKAKNGIQDMKCCSLEPDWIYFHPDMSGRIIHVGPNLIKVLKIKEIENNVTQMEIAEDFLIVANRENSVNSSVTVTASGRVVKKRFNLLDDDPEQETFKIVDYEDELDLLSIVAVTQIGADGRAHLDFHCNEHGILLKSIPLLESWDVTYSHEVYFDRDIVLHIEQKPNRRFSCYVYQMVCNTAQEEECSSHERTERVSCKKGGRIFEYT
ncbi:DDB1- and CUL4-associated factor 17 isoform X4 [Rhea pennata]|uniref:DDB1- and CUL4-associated factor 17 isoform X4 n=1 Tax=Rhea pennata TaxID=8795 RepID=UPI002E267999